MRADELVEVKTADLLFAFEEHFDVQGEAAGLLHMRFDRLEVHEHLPLVVCRAPGINLVLANRRLEWRRVPQIDWIDGLNVVMAVKQNRRSAGRVQPVSVDDWIARSLLETDVFEADTFHVLGAPLRCAPDVGLVLRQSADAWYREKLLQLLDVPIALEVDVVDDLVDVFHLWFLRMFDGEIDAIAPLFP